LNDQATDLTGNLVRSKLAEGMPVWDAFRTYGVI
jgi:hypothetical protein